MELAESENKYRTLVEHYALGVYISQHGIFKYINTRLTEMTGYSHEALLQMKFEDFFDDA